jgi:hypothetical protein
MLLIINGLYYPFETPYFIIYFTSVYFFDSKRPIVIEVTSILNRIKDLNSRLDEIRRYL